MAGIATAPHHNASTSSSTPSGSASTRYLHYDVIISFCDYNHRDPDEDVVLDVRKFARDLFGRLESCYGMKVFIDAPDCRDLVLEDNIDPVMQDVFLTPFIHIPIFSPNYALSIWCMDQLVLITKSRSAVIPIFYYVQPTELRRTGKDNKGKYAEALRNYEKNGQYGSEKIQGWRDALSHVASLSGFVVDKSHRGKEEELLNKIVQRVFTDFDLRGYHVFINHRGDVKEKYAMPLYDLLISRGLRVFLDKPELKEGLRISTQIELAIQRSSVHIAMFSPKYAESEWCLDELFQMTKSIAPIVPVFYKVSRSDLQCTEENSDGIYAQELRNPKKKQRYDLETLQRWRNALSYVAELPGFELDENHVDVILDNIVDSVLEKLSEVAPSPEDALSPEVQRVVTSVIMEDVSVGKM